MAENEMRELNRKDGGFSLIEVIVAMVILAVIAIPLMRYFTDSMQTSVRMADRQGATVLAQQITESMKAEDVLIRLVETDGGGTPSYQVPILTDTIENGGYSLVTDSSDAVFSTEGKGKAVFRSKSETEYGSGETKSPYDYDIRVTVSTEVTANSVEHPMIFGIDDATDAVATEGNQVMEAVIYYMAAFQRAHPGETCSEDTIRQNLNRDIHVKIGHDPSGTYSVQVWYEFTCGGFTGTYQSRDLVNKKMAELKNIYLMYGRISYVDAADHKEYLKSDDKIKVELQSGMTYTLPELYVICQKTSDDPSYEAWVEETDLSGGAQSLPGIHSNILPSDGTGTVHIKKSDGSQTDSDTLPVGGNDSPVRIVSLKTEVFKKGALSSGDGEALAVVETTKGE